MASLETNINQVNADFNSIKEAIISSGIEIADGTKTSEYAGKINEISNSAEDIAQQKFWDSVQRNGEKTYYIYAFCGSTWGKDTFKPRYPITAKGSSNYMFGYFNNGQPSFDLAQQLEDCGVTLDTSGSTNLSNLFTYAYVSRVPEINATGATTALNGTFRYCEAEIIDKLILKNDGTNTFTNTFQKATKLKKITIEGMIGNDISFSDCTLLTKTSISSIVNALKTDATGKTLTLSKVAVDKAFETEVDLNDGSASDEWIETIRDKSNKYDGLWTISLI